MCQRRQLAVNGMVPGTPIHYVVEAKGQTREVTLPVTRFGLDDFLLVFFVTFLGGLILIVLAVIVQVLKPNTSSSWAFFLLCFFSLPSKFPVNETSSRRLPCELTKIVLFAPSQWTHSAESHESYLDPYTTFNNLYEDTNGSTGKKNNKKSSNRS